jgi:hypothetical protein
VVLVRVREHDAANVGDPQARLSQSFVERVFSFFGFGTRVDEGDRVLRMMKG